MSRLYALTTWTTVKSWKCRKSPRIKSIPIKMNGLCEDLQRSDNLRAVFTVRHLAVDGETRHYDGRLLPSVSGAGNYVLVHLFFPSTERGVDDLGEQKRDVNVFENSRWCHDDGFSIFDEHRVRASMKIPKLSARPHVKERKRSDLPVISGCGQLEMVHITMLRSEVLVDRFMIAAIIGRYQLWFGFFFFSRHFEKEKSTCVCTKSRHKTNWMAKP